MAEGLKAALSPCPRPPGIINPALVLAHARAWAGTPFLRRAAARGFGADCIGLLRGIGAELAGVRVQADGWRHEWHRADALGRGLGRCMVPVPLHEACPGMVAACRIGTARLAHVGILSDLGGCAVHVADYAGRVVEDGFAGFADASSLWGFPLPPGCEPGPEDLTPADCLAVVYPEEGGRASVQITLLRDGTPLAFSALYPARAAALAMLAPIYPNIETVE